MILKIFRSVWFLSLMAVTVALLYVYASLPPEVVVREEGQTTYHLTRDTFFYIVLSFVAIINTLVFIIARIMVRNEEFKIWYYGLVISINFFFIVGINFVSLYNSGETYDYSRMDIIIYSSIALFILWGIGWPIYLGYRRVSGRS